MENKVLDGSSPKILLSHHYWTNIRLLISDCEPTCLLSGPHFNEGNASGRCIIYSQRYIRQIDNHNCYHTLKLTWVQSEENTECWSIFKLTKTSIPSESKFSWFGLGGGPSRVEKLLSSCCPSFFSEFYGIVPRYTHKILLRDTIKSRNNQKRVARVIRWLFWCKSQ